MSALLSDLRFALRLIWGGPGFALIAVFTLALGIGANSAMFSFVDGVLLRPLPYPRGEELIMVFEKPPQGERAAVSTLDFLDWKSQNTVFTAMAAQTGTAFTLTGTGEPMQVEGGRVTCPFFEIFGLKPILGRTFLPEEDEPGKDQVVILSHHIWESRFGSDRAVIGRQLILDGKPHTVIGVLAQGGPFDKGFQDVWTPLAFAVKERTRNVRWFRVWARLKPGVSLEQARAQMEAVTERIRKQYPESNQGWGVTVVRLVDNVTTRTLRQSLFILVGAVVAVLLIACANLANLLLSRAAAREQELAIRAAMGAGRWRLIAQFLTECLVLASAGGALGIWLAYGFIMALKAWIPPRVLPPEAEVHLDVRVLLFTAATVLVTTVVFAIGPALTSVRGDPALSLNQGARSMTASPAPRRLRDALVVAEVAIAFVVLSGAGLLLRSFYELLLVDPGFETANVLTLGLPMGADQFSDGGQISNYLTRVQEKIAQVPGVRDVATTSILPFRGWGLEMPFQIEGQPAVERAGRPTCFFKIVSPSYVRTLGMRLRGGRQLADTDTVNTPRVMVINESMTRRFFGGEDPLKSRVWLPEVVSGSRRGPDVAWQVVGIVADEKVTSLRDSVPGGYVSYRQSPVLAASLVVRSAVDPNRLTKAIEVAVREVNPRQPLADIRMLEELKSLSLGSNRLRTGLLALFAGLALALATIGIYGVLAGAVARRTREIGIRAALGATDWHHLRLVLGGGLLLAGAGVIVGFALSLAILRVLASLLFGVGPHDPWTLALVGAVLMLVSAVACYAPARRAMKIDPAAALRHE
jgi:putative ABC transport system permease protein